MSRKQPQYFNEFGVLDYQGILQRPISSSPLNEEFIFDVPHSTSEDDSSWFNQIVQQPFFDEEPLKHDIPIEKWTHKSDEIVQENFDFGYQEQMVVENNTPPIFETLSEEAQPLETKKIKKREENTILRVVVTTIRDHLKSKGFVKKVQGDVQLLQRLPGTKPGIEQLFSYLELNPNTCDFKESLLAHRHDLRKKGLVYHDDKPERESSFYEHFDLVFNALEKTNNYKDRLNMIFKNRSHTKQLLEVESFRQMISNKLQL